MDQETEITVSQDDEAVVVAATGELELSVAKKLDRAIREAAATGNPVVVDLRRADYIDSAIIECLIKAGKMEQDANRRLKVLVSPNGHPQYVLGLVGLASLLEVVANEED